MTLRLYAVLQRMIPTLEDLSASSRGALYRAAVKKTEDQIASAEPPLTREAAQAVRDELQEAIKQVEAEFKQARETAGKHAPDWALPPEPTRSPEAAIALSATPRRPEWDETIGPPAVPARADFAGKASLFLAGLGDRARIASALLARMIGVTAGGDRLAYFWLLVEPLLQVGLVVSIYWLFDRTIVYNMQAVPFAIIGVGAWLTFRTMMMRVSTGLGREFLLAFLPSVTRFDIYLSKALFYGITYFLASMAMLLIADMLGLGGEWVFDPLRFLGLWLLVWLFAFGFSLALGYVLILLPAMKRLLLVLMRGLYLFSGVVIVTEQFPEEDKLIFLWNPLTHGLQLLRSAYFADYQTTDASLAYFLFWTAVFVLFGLICERAQRRREIAA